jgi:hypothetical protein
MAEKCYKKPNRKRIRTFKTCDGVRIAKEIVVDDDTTPEALLACIAKGLGFTHISLSRVRVVESSLLPSPGAVVSAARAIIRLIESWVVRYERPLAIIRALTTIKQAIEDLISLVESGAPRQERVENVIDSGKCKCKGVL